MIDLGLTARERKALAKTLATHHLVGTTCQVMNNDMTYVQRFSPRIIDGQVNIDVDAAPTRQLSLTAFDPDAKVDVDLRDGSPRLDRMIRVYYNVFVEIDDIGWIQIPIFTGPITQVSRDAEGILSVEAVGKEEFARKPCGRTRTWAKGTNRTALIKALMRDLSGERSFDFPDGLTARTAKPLNIRVGSHPWSHSRTQARAMGRDLFYNGKGVLRLRQRPVRPSFVFKTGEGGTILTVPNIEDSSDEIINTVVVTGAIPKGKKKPIKWTEHLPSNDAYSSWNLGRHGVRSYFFDRIDDDTIRSKKEAKEVARRRLSQARIETQQVTFDSLPIPMLEENDAIRIETDDLSTTTRLRQMTIPLGHEGVSTIGYIAQVSRRRRPKTSYRVKGTLK